MRTLKSLAGKFERKRLRDEKSQEREIFFVYFCNCMCQVSMLMLLILFEVHMQHIFYVYRYAIYACLWHMFHYFFKIRHVVWKTKNWNSLKGVDFALTSPWLHDIKTEGKEQSTSNRRALEGHAPRCTTRESEKVSFNETPSGWEGQMGGGGGEEFALKISWRIIWGLVSG